MTLTLATGRLDGFYAEASALAGRNLTLRLREIRLGTDVLPWAAAFATQVGDTPRVVLVMDETVIERAGEPVKPRVAHLLKAAGCAVEPVVVAGGEVHTTAAHIADVAARLRSGDVVVALGSGTIADITKHAVHGFERAHPGQRLRLLVIQTANSVCAFTSGLAVVTTDNVKRTVPSRLPDALLVDTRMLADAPPAYTQGGVGDAAVAAVSFADYRLGHLLGLSGWEPVSWSLIAPSRARFLGQGTAPASAPARMSGPPPDVGRAGTLALDLAACGLAMTYAGESAPLSGLEHVTSHMLDMAAERDGRPVGNHGSQCALAALLSLICWEKLLTQVDRLDLDPDDIDEAAERRRVRDTFAGIDADGSAARECWADFGAKIASWRAHRESVVDFTAHWRERRDELASYLTTPREFAEALSAAGHPLRFDAIPTGLDEHHVRWALTGARLMRKRTTVADLLGFAGLWGEDFIDDVFARYHSLLPAGPAATHTATAPAEGTLP